MRLSLMPASMRNKPTAVQSVKFSEENLRMTQSRALFTHLSTYARAHRASLQLEVSPTTVCGRLAGRTVTQLLATQSIASKVDVLSAIVLYIAALTGTRLCLKRDRRADLRAVCDSFSQSCAGCPIPTLFTNRMESYAGLSGCSCTGRSRKPPLRGEAH